MAVAGWAKVAQLIWLITSLFCSLSITMFYIVIFAVLGVPTESIMGAYMCLAVLNILIVIALVIGIYCLLQNIDMSRAASLCYNIYLALILVFSMIVVLIFAHDTPRDEVVNFLSQNHAGALTFIQYLESKLNCCGILSSDMQRYYEYASPNVTNDSSVEYILGSCHESENKPGCLDNISTFSDLMKLNVDIKNIFLLQEFLPVFTMIEIFVLFLLFNMYIEDGEMDLLSDSDGSLEMQEQEPVRNEPRNTTARTRLSLEYPRSSRRTTQSCMTTPRLAIISELYSSVSQGSEDDPHILPSIDGSYPDVTSSTDGFDPDVTSSTDGSDRGVTSSTDGIYPYVTSSTDGSDPDVTASTNVSSETHELNFDAWNLPGNSNPVASAPNLDAVVTDDLNPNRLIDDPNPVLSGVMDASKL